MRLGKSFFKCIVGSRRFNGYEQSGGGKVDAGNSEIYLQSLQKVHFKIALLKICGSIIC